MGALGQGEPERRHLAVQQHPQRLFSVDGQRDHRGTTGEIETHGVDHRPASRIRGSLARVQIRGLPGGQESVHPRREPALGVGFGAWMARRERQDQLLPRLRGSDSTGEVLGGLEPGLPGGVAEFGARRGGSPAIPGVQGLLQQREGCRMETLDGGHPGLRPREDDQGVVVRWVLLEDPGCQGLGVAVSALRERPVGLGQAAVLRPARRLRIPTVETAEALIVSEEGERWPRPVGPGVQVDRGPVDEDLPPVISGGYEERQSPAGADRAGGARVGDPGTRGQPAQGRTARHAQDHVVGHRCGWGDLGRRGPRVQDQLRGPLDLHGYGGAAACRSAPRPRWPTSPAHAGRCGIEPGQPTQEERPPQTRSQHLRPHPALACRGRQSRSEIDQAGVFRECGKGLLGYSGPAPHPPFDGSKGGGAVGTAELPRPDRSAAGDDRQQRPG